MLKTPIAIQKTCACGILHNLIPVGAKPQLVSGVIVGWVWNCECKSTLLYWILPKEEIIALTEREAA